MGKGHGTGERCELLAGFATTNGQNEPKLVTEPVDVGWVVQLRDRCGTQQTWRLSHTHNPQAGQLGIHSPLGVRIKGYCLEPGQTIQLPTPHGNRQLEVVRAAQL